MRAILSQQLARFRAWTHAQLAERVERDRTAHGCLDSSDGVASDGTAYFIEFNAFWDDRPGGDVRVCGYLSVASQRPLFGFVPIYRPDASQCFIMNPGGQFIGDDESLPRP